MYQNPLMDADAWRPKWWQAAVATLLIIATFVIGGETFRQTLRYSIQGIALFILFSFVLSEVSPQLNYFLGCKPLVWIGLVSYTLYLCHMAIFRAVGGTLQISPLVGGLIGAPLAAFFAYGMRVFVEVPILDWRRKRRSKRASVASEPTMDVHEAVLRESSAIG